MNKIHHLIYCTATQSWVVASEYAKANGKKASGVCGSTAGATQVDATRFANTFKSFTRKAIVLAIASLGWSNTVQAGSVCGGQSGASGANQVACGNGAKNSSGGNNWGGIAIGAYAETGDSTKNHSPMAIGVHAWAKDGRSPIAIGDWATAIGDHAIAIGGKEGGKNEKEKSTYASGNNSLAIGYFSTATAEDAVALGRETITTAKGAVALGSQSLANRAALTTPTPTATDTVTDVNTQVFALSSATAADKASIVATASNTLGAVSVGKADATRQIINVAAGSADSDAVNVAQLRAVARQIASGTGGTGGTVVISKPTTVSAGKNITVTETTNPDGSKDYAVATKDNVDFDSVTTGPVTINKGGSGNITINNGNAGNPVTLGKNGLDNGGNRITNVAAGTAPTDAVNVAQLNDAIAGINDGAYAAAAAGIAAANLPQPHDPGKSMVSAGLGYYEGESAFAVGVSSISDNGRWIIKGSASIDTQSNVGVGAGVGYQW